jgi:hypothetical protein
MTRKDNIMEAALILANIGIALAWVGVIVWGEIADGIAAVRERLADRD